MTDIIDRRHQKSSRNIENRKKFIERHKKSIKEQVNAKALRNPIKKVLKRRKLRAYKHGTNEPVFQHEDASGKKHRVTSGNKRYTKGDKITRPIAGEGSKRGSGGSADADQGLVDFQFILTKQEFLDILFEDMELPFYVKEAIQEDTKYKWINAGYCHEGPISRLALVKTFEQSLARRLASKKANKDKKKKIPFLDDIDLRYKLKAKEPLPIRKAVIFCVQDTSYSMCEEKRELAKRFFLLLYVFLEQKYDEVDLVFIKHTQDAQETTEEDFFYGTDSGGTICSSAFVEVDRIINERYDTDKVNIYVAQASDGDNWINDNEFLLNILEDKILPVVQYMAYIQVDPGGNKLGDDLPPDFYLIPSLWTLYKCLTEKYTHFNKAFVTQKTEVFEALQYLFKKD